MPIWHMSSEGVLLALLVKWNYKVTIKVAGITVEFIWVTKGI